HHGPIRASPIAGARSVENEVIAMTGIKLTYFDTPSSRGEECRLALHLAGVPFVDERLKVAEFVQRRADTPFGALPVLTVEGHPPLAQTNTILRLIGRRYELH